MRFWIKTGNELDDLAYKLYMDNTCEDNFLWLSQVGLMKSTLKEKYYKVANIMLRKRKIKNIIDGRKK